jgi:hypothetical protein
MSGYDLPIRDDNEREWYANVGRIQEKERIIKLLEELQDHFRRCSHESGQPRAIEIAIALIKGEK